MEWMYLALPGALVLGLISWGTAIAGLFGRRMPALSLGCCAAALFCAGLSYHQEVVEGDWSALLDTSGTLIVAEGVLLAVALVLNIAGGLNR